MLILVGDPGSGFGFKCQSLGFRVLGLGFKRLRFRRLGDDRLRFRV